MNTNLKKLAKKGTKKQLLVSMLMVVVLIVGVCGLIGNLRSSPLLRRTAFFTSGQYLYDPARSAELSDGGKLLLAGHPGA